jgi:hypothetical protein
MFPSLNDIYKLDLCVTTLAPNPITTRGCTDLQQTKIDRRVHPCSGLFLGRECTRQVNVKESEVLYVLLRSQSDAYTEELLDGMEERGMGLAENYCISTVNDHLRSLCFTVKRTQLRKGKP